MSFEPIVTQPWTTRAAELLIEHGISGLPVIDAKSKVRGIVIDIVRAMASAA